MTKTKGEKKNVSIITTITGLAGFGALRLIEYAGQALATGAYTPTVGLYQGVIGLGIAGLIAGYYARTGVTSLPLDDATIQDLIIQLGEEAKDTEDELTE